MILGISGKIGAGKDAIAAHLVEYHGFKLVRFSEPLKEEILRIMRKTCEEIWKNYWGLKDTPTEDELRELIWNIKPPIMRRMLQEWGTELRRHENADYWTKKWERTVETLTDQGVSVVAPDLRFQNEAASVRRLGGTILRVTRPGCADGDHDSEIEMDSLLPDIVIENDGTLEKLKLAIDLYMQ